MVPWAKLCAAYPGYDIGKPTLVVYHERLGKYPVNRIMAAVEAAIDQCEFFPKVAELKAHIENQPAPTPALLEAPRPPAEEIAKLRATLKTFIVKTAGQDDERKAAAIRDRKALLRKQLETLNAAEKNQAH